MKKILFAFLASSLLMVAQAQITFNGHDDGHQTLLGNDFHFGGFLGLGAKAAVIENQEGILVGGEVAVSFNRRLNLGVAGYGLATNLNSVNLADDGGQLFHELGYGGLLIEPVLFGKKLIHVSFPVVLGAGGITETSRPYTDTEAWNEPYPAPLLVDYQDYDVFLLAEPGVSLELNVARWMRISAGVSKRFATDVTLNGIDRDVIGGLSSHLTLRLGWF